MVTRRFVFIFLAWVNLTHFTSGNRVQWFRAEADMRRWQEQIEQKLAEFLRCIRSFGKMKDGWTKLAFSQSPDLPGHVAYAKKTADMYARMERDAERRLDDAGYNGLRLKATNDYGALLDYVIARRAEEEVKLKSGAN
jgi:hypothetical protein